MTCEICVMNRSALVLAADSAVTVSRFEQGQRTERYFKGSNKIFEVSSFQPIGAMIFDSADLQRVPWETIVKAFRAKIGSKKLGTVEDYANAFFKFIKDDEHLFPVEYRERLLVTNIDQAIIQALRAALEDNRVKDAEAQQRDDAIKIVLGEYLATARARPTTIFNAEEIAGIIAKHTEKLIEEAQTDITLFGANTTFPAEELVEIGAMAFLKRPEMLLNSTGLVFAGFSDNDYFPSYVEFACQGFVADRLSFAKQSEYQISTHDSGYWNAFATTDMVDTFTMGFGPDVFANVRSQVSSTLRSFAQALQDEFHFVCPELDERVEELTRDHTHKWTEAVFERHSRPLKGVIGSLPVDEMANLAETLIMLESLKEKVTQSSESVSGPIDVAVITKHEGLVWAKRKHFFRPELNPRFFERQHQKYLVGQEQ